MFQVKALRQREMSMSLMKSLRLKRYSSYIGSTLTFHFDLYFNTAYAVRYVY